MGQTQQLALPFDEEHEWQAQLLPPKWERCTQETGLDVLSYFILIFETIISANFKASLK